MHWDTSSPNGQAHSLNLKNHTQCDNCDDSHSQSLMDTKYPSLHHAQSQEQCLLHDPKDRQGVP